MLLRDILRGDDQVDAVVEVIRAASADVLLLTGMDMDREGATLAALTDRLSESGIAYPHSFTTMGNTGLRTGVDLDGDGRLEEPEDAQGFGRFPGEGSMAVLSRYPLAPVQELTDLLWRDLPGGDPWFASDEAAAVQRLSSVAHWDVRVEAPGGPLHLLAFSATPPVFDGEEDRNGRRAEDELRVWQVYLDGGLSGPPDGPAVIAGRINVDPVDGEGRRTVLRAMRSGPLQDPAPEGPGGMAEADARHNGPPGQDTVDWDGPGNLRVDYVLPQAGLEVAGAGVLWPVEGQPLNGLSLATARAASRHRLVWVDLVLDR
ncbi:endonuclease/exonuclease/phosphatase family protein [Oceanicola sp. D3]|uniref:endonuclease/exonuclease/phosphatase family protein n=1 Tax=Oceanicola sp. D3 TaxID=2587163 RepID=UPI00143DF6BE|nr:endonuclease/exonuclease/phosphatase family protein [Oceanicola sp. D3]